MFVAIRDGGPLTWLVLLLSLGAIAAAIAHAASPARWSLATAVGLGAAAAVFGLLATVVGINHSFRAVANVAPELRAELLSKSISGAMTATAIASLALPFWIVPVIVGEVRRRKPRPRPPG